MKRCSSKDREPMMRKAIEIIGESVIEKLYKELGSERLSTWHLHDLVLRNKMQKAMKTGTFTRQSFAKQEKIPFWKAHRLMKTVLKIKKQQYTKANKPENQEIQGDKEL